MWTPFVEKLLAQLKEYPEWKKIIDFIERGMQSKEGILHYIQENPSALIAALGSLAVSIFTRYLKERSKTSSRRK